MRHALVFRRFTAHWLPIAPAAVLSAMVACRSGQDVPKVPLAQAAVAESLRAVESAHSLIGPAAKTALDSGNVLFRKKAYAPALTEYRLAATLAPQHAAPLFGIYMVARATNNTAMADSALIGIRQRNGPLPPNAHVPPAPD
jgi:hypothetical protein